jgi:sphinganine-1-phosphate aldolase
MRCYRNYGIDVRGHAPGESIILASKSVHAAVLKAGQAYLIQIILIDVDEKGCMDTDDLWYKLCSYGDQVVAIVGSAPSYPTGVTDPIQIMANMADALHCGFHVDCCLGGFIINNLPQHNCDYLSFKGVTSLSADTHKNGLAPKGSSVLVTRKLGDVNLAYYSIYSIPEWSGGVYGTSKDAGSQSCVHSLTALIAMLATGKDGYKRIAADIYENTIEMAAVIKSFPNELVLIAEPEVNVVAFKISDKAKMSKGAIYALAHEMSNHNFILNTLNGESVHFCITLRFASDSTAIERFREALTKSLIAVKRMNDDGVKFPGDAGMYCSLETAMSPTLENLSYQKYIENTLLGKLGARDAIKSFFLAHMNPYI